MHGPTLLFVLLVSIFCADYCVLAKHAHPARPRAAERPFHKRNAHSFDNHNPLVAKRQVKADDIRSGKKKRDCPVPLVSGVCNCPSGTFCNNDCVDTTTDPANCGACNFDCATEYATGSECLDSNCYCLIPELLCNGACVNTQTDSNNCGGCGTVCDDGATCQSGACVCTDTGLHYCAGSCVDFTSDDFNCGSCGFECGFLMLCEDSVCEPA